METLFVEQLLTCKNIQQLQYAAAQYFMFRDIKFKATFIFLWGHSHPHEKSYNPLALLYILNESICVNKL